jgi:hypothetical protein
MLKLTLVRLTFNHIFRLFGMIAWGVGTNLFNVKTKQERNEDLAFVIQTTEVKYAKALRSA